MTRAELARLYPDIVPKDPPAPPEPPAAYEIEPASAYEIEPASAYEIEPASAWAGREPPPARDWICEGLSIGAGRVCQLNANGGTGKTLTALQLMLSVASGQPLFGMPVSGGTTLGIFCEDEQHELERRGRDAAKSLGVDLESLDNMHAFSRDGEDNVLCNFDRDLIQLTENYWRLDATVARYKPRLTILDTAADMFAGDFISTPHVRQFIKVALGGLCSRHGTAILLLAHPSTAAMANGDGSGFSTAWNNSVRTRLYMRHPKSEDQEAAKDRRVLEVKKSNYGPTGGSIPLIYRNGAFVLDPEPLEEGPKTLQPAKAADTKLAVAAMDYFRSKGAAGGVVRFREVFEDLQGAGHVSRGDYEAVRKPLQRTLNTLVQQGMLKASQMPRGYRLERQA